MTQMPKGKGNLVDPKLMDELAKSGVKYNSDEVLMVTKNLDGKLLWLEKGNPKKGLEHILNHSDDLLAKGVDVHNIPAFIKNDLLTQPLLIQEEMLMVYLLISHIIIRNLD